MLNLTKIYCWILPVLPIMSMYGITGLGLLTFSDYLLMLCYLLCMMQLARNNKISCRIVFLPLVTYLLVHPALLNMYTSEHIDWGDEIGTCWRLAFYIFPLCVLSPNYIDKNRLILVFRFVGTISSLYACAQFFLGTFFSVSLSPYLPFLPVVREGLEKQQQGWIDYGWMVRARAWFSEPSTLAIFLVLALFIEWFITNRSRYKKYFVSCYIIGILVAHSSTGMFALMVLGMEYVYNYLTTKKFKVSIDKGLKLCFLLPVILICIYKTGYIDRFILHTFANGAGISQQSHFSTMFLVFENEFNFMEMLFGHGMQDVADVYLPGWVGTYYSLGATGIVLYAFIFVSFWGRKTANYLIVLFSILNIGTEIMLGVYLLLYLSVAMILENKKAGEVVAIEKNP